MKKIFSFLLIAVGLLISGQMKAVDVTTNLASDIQAQIDAAHTAGDDGRTINVTLNGDMNITATIQLYALQANPGCTVNIDLAGHTIQSSTVTLFEVYKGTLNIYGQGELKETASKEAIFMYGYDLDEVPNWSNLKIGKDVKLTASSTAISVYGYQGDYYPRAWGELSGKLCDGIQAPHYLREFDDYKALCRTKYVKSETAKILTTQATTKSSNALYKAGKVDWVTNFMKYATTPATNKDAYHNSPGIKSSNLEWEHDGEDFYSSQNNQSTKAYGVTIDIAGYVYGEKYGVKVNGTVKYDGENIPAITIQPSAEVASNPTATKSVAVYASGVGSTTIKGYVHGNVGVYAKSGIVNIVDATIKSDNPDATPATGQKSGVDAGGSAIVIESNSSYYGSQNVTISGNSQIIGGGGYAVEETITTAGESKVSHIQFDGGTFSGNSGAVIISDNTAANEVVTIYGGNYVGESAQGDLSNLVDESKYAFEVQGDKVIMVVGDKSQQPTTTTTINAATEMSCINVSAGTETLTADKTLDFVNMNAATTLTIPAGKALSVGCLMMSKDAQIIIEPNAKLNVMGVNGLETVNANNLVVKASSEGMGSLIFNTIVEANKSPYATVEYYSQTHIFGEGADAVDKYDVMVSPFAKIDELFNSQAGKGYFFEYQYWDKGAGKWKSYANKADVVAKAKPFEPIIIANNTPKGEGTIYTFKGQLQGNISGILSLSKGFNYIGNAYLAAMDIKSMMAELVANGKIEPSIWTWDFKSQSYTLTTLDNLQKMKGMNALGFFVIKAKEEVNLDMNYQKLIWNFNNQVE